MEIIERQEPEMNGGRFNSILHSKNQAHDLLSRCLNRAFRSECSFEHNFCGQMVDASVVGYEKESDNREIAHTCNQINMLIGVYFFAIELK